MIGLALLLLQQPASAPEPGAYWQQEVAYEIEARLDEPIGVLSGTERIRYTNRSPDTLTTFSLHLYLNAFRPGSRWSDADSAEGRRRFNDLRDPDYAFNHVRNVRIMGAPVQPVYPFAPDSTIVRFALPRPLPPGESMSVEMDWDARPSTLPRRQGRQGRRFDFAQWYPKVVVYDRYGWAERPLYPAGEFYGEFGIVPGGSRRAGGPGGRRHRRCRSAVIRDGSGPTGFGPDRSTTSANYYGARTPSATPVTGPAAGRKKIRWYAEDVHHFAMSLNPEYRYEGGRYEDVAVHVLYQPGDEHDLGQRRSRSSAPSTALAWLDRLFGTFAWPQLTNVHRIEGGGTEFPMMVMDGSADQGLIVHEVGHNYTMGILANNEWREGWLDEGFTSFQTTWFWETQGKTGRLRAERGHDPGARSRRLLRADQPEERGVPRLHLLQHLDLQPGRAVLPAAALHRGRRDDAPHPPDLLRPLEAQACGRGGLPGRGGGGVAAGSVHACSARGCTRPSCTTMRWGR